jgi:hypothetical protein
VRVAAIYARLFSHSFLHIVWISEWSFTSRLATFIVMGAIPDSIKAELLSERQKQQRIMLDAQQRISEIDTVLAQDAGIINWTDKAERAIREAGYPLTTLEILEGIFATRRADLNTLEKRKNYVVQLSVALNRLCARGELFSLPVKGYKGKLYCAAEWRDALGQVKLEYKYIIENKIEKLMRQAKSGTQYSYAA